MLILDEIHAQLGGRTEVRIVNQKAQFSNYESYTIQLKKSYNGLKKRLKSLY